MKISGHLGGGYLPIKEHALPNTQFACPSSNSPRSGPLPARASRQTPGKPATASTSRSTPFSGTKRPHVADHKSAPGIFGPFRRFEDLRIDTELRDHGQRACVALVSPDLMRRPGCQPWHSRPVATHNAQTSEKERDNAGSGSARRRTEFVQPARRGQPHRVGRGQIVGFLIDVDQIGAQAGNEPPQARIIMRVKTAIETYRFHHQIIALV